MRRRAKGRMASVKSTTREKTEEKKSGMDLNEI